MERRRNPKKLDVSGGASDYLTPTATPQHNVRPTISLTPLAPTGYALPLSSPIFDEENSIESNSAASMTTTADLGSHILFGLSFAGVAVCCLSTLFELFHVDVFLRAYQLPPTTYSVGRMMFSFLSTGSSLWGAWWMDSQVATTPLQRFELVGFSGLLLAISFILPFGRFWGPYEYTPPEEEEGATTNNSAILFSYWWHVLLDGWHFVVSMSLYDGLSTIVTILLASAVSDDHNMTDYERIQNSVGSQIWNLLASMVVASIGVNLFDVHSLYKFQCFVVVIALLSILVFGAAQSIISGHHQQYAARNSKRSKVWHIWKGWTTRLPHDRIWAPATPSSLGKKKVVWKQAFRDLWGHANFRRWMVLEMLLELQTHFLQTFFKTFVDQLLVDIHPTILYWLLSLFRPVHQTLAILCYIPIRWYGYGPVYTVLLVGLFLLSSITILSSTPSSTGWILVFLVLYAASTEAVRAAAYYMVVSDLVLELKLRQAMQGRFDEPSLAGILLGATTLACKPVQSILPILAANLLHHYPMHGHVALYYLLVVPPWICCLIQLYVWQFYDLHPKRTHEMRIELHYLKQERQQPDQQELSRIRGASWKEGSPGSDSFEAERDQRLASNNNTGITGTHKRHLRRDENSKGGIMSV